MNHDASHDWIATLQRRGWSDPLCTLLDALEPLGPVGAQILWAAQPALRLIGVRSQDAVSALALALEEPGGVQLLQARLRAPLAHQDDDSDSAT
jgi:hypothetical protein